MKRDLTVVVGSGGVGKTTLAAALGLEAARGGDETLVMTFDPSLRLKDALGVGTEAHGREVAVPVAGAGRLDASLLDARDTFDRLVERYAPDEAARRRILDNRYYDHLSGSLAGVLEYMAVERLFEVAAEERYDRVILDTPPTRQALDFLEAPERIIGFLDSGALKVALRQWFDGAGRLRPARRLGFLGRRVEGWLDRVIGLDFLRDMSEFFQAFEPLYAGFRQRAEEVRQLLRAPGTRFLLVAGPGEERIPDTLFFARKIREAGFRLTAVIVNRVHPELTGLPQADEAGEEDGDGAGLDLLRWLGERDRDGLRQLSGLLRDQPLVEVPLRAGELSTLKGLGRLGRDVQERLTAVAD